MSFEIYKDRSGDWRWRGKSNGHIIADSGEGYTTKVNCEHGLGLFKNAKKSDYTVYPDSIGEYRWRCKSSNGNIIADSAEGYKNKSDCEAMIDMIIREASSASTTFLD